MSTTQQTTRTQTRERADAANRVDPDFASVQHQDGVAFSKGNMLVNGAPQVPARVQHWESTNGLSTYTTVEWTDPATQEKRVSCNCPGWAFAKAGKLRRCKHTDAMMGISVCNATPVDREPIMVQNIQEAEEKIPRFDGRPLRGIMLD